MRRLIYLGLAALFAPPLLAQDGLSLYQSFNGTTTFLIDASGSVVNSWAGGSPPALSVYLLPDGDMLRTRSLGPGPGGSGGGLQRLSYDGTLEWDYVLSTSTQTPHHDVEWLPNGNVLMIVWEEIGGAAAIALGRDPTTVGSSFIPDAIYELEQTGASTADIVWEWHTYDHVVQDFDATLPGFGVVADHPELVDINYGSSGDWMHVNGIDYHPGFDQIAISVPNFDEVWIIDHSTTTEEAAGHSGGNSGRGGDLLYRWGNPLAYDRGTVADQVFFFIHDVQWIEPGRPGEGNLIVFNNGRSRPTGDWSSADEWIPPVDASGNYTLAPGMAYGPADLTWTYSAGTGFFSNIMGGVERLTNGETLITDSSSARMFQVDPSGAITWSYINTDGTPPWVFKTRRYADCDGNGVFDGHELETGAGDDLNGNGVLDVCESPVNYCTANANSTGLPAVMGWSGSTSITANDFALSASQCPTNLFGLFAYSAGQAQIPLGEGNLCLSTPIYRLAVVSTGPTGTAMLDFDNQNLPSMSPDLSPGTTWNFTFWYRDTAGGPVGFNLTDGLSVLFTQ